MFNKFRQECENLLDGKRLELPPRGVDADLAFPCFSLAKEQKKAPQEIAKELEQLLSRKEKKLVGEVKAQGPYLNFYINHKKFSPLALKIILKEKENYGAGRKNKKVVVIDYSSPNIAKPLTIGHLSTTIVGQALYNIYTFLGYKCIGDNHLGDWGTQFGKLTCAYKKWGDKAKVEKNPIEELLSLYVRFHKEAEQDPKLEDEAREWFRHLEEGNKEATTLWKWFVNVSMSEFNKLYKILGVRFDYFIGESFYIPIAKNIVGEVLRKNIAKKEQSAVVVTFEDMPTALVQKSDETTLYMTRDLATIKYQKKKFHFWKRLYVVGSEQKLHFRQLFKIAQLLGYIKEGECVHVDVGQISLPTGKISTRKGNVIFMEDVIKKTIELAEKIIEEKNPKLKNKKIAAQKVGLGAIKYSNLSRDRSRDNTFDWDQMLSFEGDTGPYLQYTYARANSILKKSKKTGRVGKLTDVKETNMIKKLSKFSETVEKAAAEYKPNLLANYLFEVATQFNEFYHSVHVIGAEDESQKLALVESVMQVLENGLRLLGIDVLKEM